MILLSINLEVLRSYHLNKSFRPTLSLIMFKPQTKKSQTLPKYSESNTLSKKREKLKNLICSKCPRAFRRSMPNLRNQSNPHRLSILHPCFTPGLKKPIDNTLSKKRKPKCKKVKYSWISNKGSKFTQNRRSQIVQSMLDIQPIFTETAEVIANRIKNFQRLGCAYQTTMSIQTINAEVSKRSFDRLKR
ncbi:unnamed protein product [Moneuplotes crassus]|uniref:Uncharacterized protein n=1 Tax=Euplotes crassus TaxID=5936 RepID=A0AAD1XN59_EUPCR|nr:unnamed protein product [Moneuplotes crassus]